MENIKKLITKLANKNYQIGLYPKSEGLRKESDVIEKQLIDEIEYKTKDNWISAEGRLPENTEKDLNNVKLNFSDSVILFGDDISTVGYYDFELKSWLFEGEHLEKVTHWQPLPTPPKQ